MVGAKGFLGRHLYAFYRRFHPQTLGTHHSPCEGLAHCDLLRPSLDWLKEPCEYVAIAAGVATPKACLIDPIKTHQCNVEGSLAIGRALIERGITPIFFSSDYVFNGIDNTIHSPLNTYGKQKAELEERALQELGGNYLMIRLTKLYGLEKGDGTFFDDMAARLMENKPLVAAYDQVCAPISVEEVVRGVWALQRQQARGVFHFAGPEYASRYEMACYMAEKLQVEKNLVTKIPLAEWQDGVTRPKCVRVPSTLQALPWKEGVNQIVKQYARERDLGSDG